METCTSPSFPTSVCRGLEALPDELLVEISKHLELHDSSKRTGLRSLSLASKRLLGSCNEACSSLSFAGIKALKLPRLLARFSYVTSLNLGFLFDCSEEVLVSVGKHCPRLRELIVPETIKAPNSDGDNCSSRPGQGLLSVCHGCPKLGVLSLPSYKGSEDALLALGMARELKVLRVKGAVNLNDDVVRCIATNCGNIEELDLSFNSITDASLQCIGASLPQLKRLDLKHCKQVTGSGVADIAKGCRLLQMIHLGCLELNDECLIALGRYSKQLKELWLDYGAGAEGMFTQEAMGVLAQGCRRLRLLSLRGNKQVDDQSLRGLAKGCLSLEDLDLHACSDVADLALRSIVTGCKQLRVLVLTGTSVGPAGEATFEGGLPHLHTLRLNGELITDLVLKSVGKNCPAITELHVNNSRVSDVGLEAVLGSCKLLHTLSMKCCVDVKAEAFAGSSLPDLQTVHLPSCGVTDQGLAGLLSAAPKLSSLVVSSCAKLTPKGCAELVRSSSSLASLVITGCPQLSRDDVVLLTRVAKPVLKQLRVSRPGSLDDEYTLKRMAVGWSLPCWARVGLSSSKY